MSQSENPGNFAAFIGIDWGDHHHDYALQIIEDLPLEKGRLLHSPQSIEHWAQQLRDRFAGRPIAVCLEQTKGALIHALLKYDFFILFPVHPRTLAKYRQTFYPSHAKDDPMDAGLQLDFLLKHRDHLKMWKPEETTTRKLQLLVEMRRKLVNDRVRITNRVTSLLKEFYPQSLDWFEHKDTQVFCDFLMQWPTLQQLKKATDPDLISFFKQHRSYRPALMKRRLEQREKTIPLTCDEALLFADGLMLQAYAQQISQLLSSIKKFDSAIEELCVCHEDFTLFDSLPATGKVFTARLIAAMGTDRQRFDKAEELLNYSGVSPVLEKSGKKHWVHWRYACSKFLRQSFVEWAAESRHHSFWAHPFYQHKRNQGQSHNAAVRVLTFKWLRIIFRLWKNREIYDENKYLMALQQRGVAWLVPIANQKLSKT